jgi:hypothetical protein
VLSIRSDRRFRWLNACILTIVGILKMGIKC